MGEVQRSEPSFHWHNNIPRKSCIAKTGAPSFLSRTIFVLAVGHSVSRSGAKKGDAMPLCIGDLGDFRECCVNHWSHNEKTPTREKKKKKTCRAATVSLGLALRLKGRRLHANTVTLPSTRRHTIKYVIGYTADIKTRFVTLVRLWQLMSWQA